MLMTAFGMASQLQAAFYTETASVLPTAATSFAFDFAKFNAALGTLNSIDLILTPVVGDIGYSVYNIGSAPQTVAYAQVSDPNGTLVNSALGLSASWSSSETLAQDNFTANPGLNTGSLPFSSFALTPSSIVLGPAGFTGTGTYDLTVNSSATAISSISAGPPLFVAWYDNVGGTLAVTYNYSAVPEPASMGKFAGLLALGALLLVVRKKFRAAA